jgi:hypothetical protein
MKKKPAGFNRARTSAAIRKVLPAAFLLAAGVLQLWAETLPPATKRPVYITASFRDKNDLFIENLSRDEVEILENGKPRAIEFIARDEIPSVYGIIFDRGMLPESIDDERFSARMNTGALTARSMAYELIDKLLGKQLIWVAAYEKELQVALEEARDGFTAKAAIQELHGRRRPEEGFLYSALFSAARKMNERIEKRRVLILFIEDIDIETVNKLKPLKSLYAASNIELFVVSNGAVLSSKPGRAPSTVTTSSLKELVQSTAGYAFFTREYRDHYEDIMRRMLNQIRTFYTFGIESESEPGVPEKLQIRCLRPGCKVTYHPYVASPIP